MMTVVEMEVTQKVLAVTKLRCLRKERARFGMSDRIT